MDTTYPGCPVKRGVSQSSYIFLSL